MPTFTFQDIFKSSFLERLDAVSLPDAAIALALAFCLGLFIFLVYKKCYAGVMYAPSFGVTLIALTLITTLLILAVTSNIVLSLGMVGALSIVRFRTAIKETAIKEPMDIAFLFWAIAAGIVLAAGLIPLAVVGSLFVGVVLLVFSRQKNGESPYILVVHCADQDVEGQVRALVEARVRRLNLKSKSVAPGQIELNYEVRLRDADTEFVNELGAMEGVGNVVRPSYWPWSSPVCSASGRLWASGPPAPRPGTPPASLTMAGSTPWTCGWRTGRLSSKTPRRRSISPAPRSSTGRNFTRWAYGPRGTTPSG